MHIWQREEIKHLKLDHRSEPRYNQTEEETSFCYLCSLSLQPQFASSLAGNDSPNTVALTSLPVKEVLHSNYLIKEAKHRVDFRMQNMNGWQEFVFVAPQ